LAEEYYDFDAELRRRRSLAEESLGEQMLGITRLVAKSILLTRDIVAALSSGDDVKLSELHAQASQNKTRVESMKEDALAYLARLGDLLPTSTLYRDVFLNLARIAQIMEGIAYRAYVMASNSTIQSETIKELMARMASVLSREFEKLEAAIHLLPSNPRKSYEEAQMTSALEDEIDELYRQITFTMYKELHNDIVALMLFKDIVDMAEDVADLLRDTAEDVKFLALHQAQHR